MDTQTTNATRLLSITALSLVLAATSLLTACGNQGDAELAARVQRIEDRIEIEQLIFGEYPLALDSRNWSAYAATFAKEGELVQGDQVTKGREAIEELFSRPRQPRPRPTTSENTDGAPAQPVPEQQELRISKHVISNLKLDFESDEKAIGTAYWQTISTRGRTTVVAGAGHYNDVLIKEDGHWRFLSREIVNPLRAAAQAAAAKSDE